MCVYIYVYIYMYIYNMDTTSSTMYVHTRRTNTQVVRSINISEYTS